MADFHVEPAGVPRARAMVERATWAARSFATYDYASTLRVAQAVADCGHDSAARYAEWAVRETGFGVVEHKTLKNQLCSRGIIDTYRDEDLVTPRVDAARKIVEVPRPAGVVLALTPSTNPVSTLFFKTVLAMLTRNAVIVSPHPLAKECSSAAAHELAAAAVAAGAPDGAIQVVDEPSIPLINALMTDPRTDVVVATGGPAVVRAAYRSGNPAIGVGPGNSPVLVDRTADLTAAATRLVDSKAFDNSVLCTNESVVIVEEVVADAFEKALTRAGAHVVAGADRDAVRACVFPGGEFDVAVVGKDAAWIAARAGIRVPPRTRVLVAPFDLAVPEEPLAHEKLCPVLGLVRVPDAARGIDVARAVLRIGGSGHSAVVHSTDPATVMRFASQVPVLRVSVNVGGSTGSAGFDTNLAPSMTIGTGFVGRSSMGENLEPRHLVDWTRIAYNADACVPMGDFTGLVPWSSPTGPVPGYPVASNAGHEPSRYHRETAGSSSSGTAELREEIRRMVIEELNAIIRG